MELYRGYDSQYKNFGVKDTQTFVWTTDDEEYANEYCDTVVEFDVDENKLICADIYDLENVDEYFDPIDFDEEQAKVLRDEGYNCFAFTLDNGSDVYVILDKKLLTNFKQLTEAGYAGFSKSNNAVEAESENKFPASIAAKKLGVSTAAIKACIPTNEWHHYGTYYNEVYVYDITPYLMLKNNEDMSEYYDEDEIQEFKNTYQEMKDMSKKIPTDEKKYKANVKYIEWGGSRKHPTATTINYNNITVIEKGQFYTFILPDKTTVRKKIGSNGTEVTPMEEIKRRIKAEKERSKMMKERFAEFKKNSSAKALKFMKNNKLESNSSSTHFYMYGRKPTSWDYDNLSNFFKKGELRLSTKNPDQPTTAGVFLEEWDGEKWIPIEDNTITNAGEYISAYDIYQFLKK